MTTDYKSKEEKMKKIVINRCFGGFGLSHEATERYLELKGKKAYFFTQDYSKGIENTKYIPMNKDEKSFMDTVFTIPNPNEYFAKENAKDWSHMTPEEREAHNNYHDAVSFYSRALDRDDSTLIQVIEELGPEKASARFAELKVVEIPDGIEWEIDEYDGLEKIEEKHKIWE